MKILLYLLGLLEKSLLYRDFQISLSLSLFLFGLFLFDEDGYRWLSGSYFLILCSSSAY